MTKTYLDQNNQVANIMLERIYYKPFREGRKDLEIFLLGQCSAQCKYCYLHKYGKDLYPQEYSSFELILQNYELILNWYVKNKFTNAISLFSAEWLDKKDFCNNIFSITYKVFSTSEYKPKEIIIPSNLQFLKNKEITNLIQNWIDKLQTDLNIHVLISGSIDGKYCDDDRTSCDDDFYLTCNEFFKKNDYRFHPMVSSFNVKNWIDNYTWWRTQMLNGLPQTLMMLEVRDETWTNDSIVQLLEFLNYQIDYQFETDFHNDKKEFLKYLLRIENKYNNYFPNYHNIGLSLSNSYDNTDTINCSVNHNCLVIRAGDLAVIACHRQGYEELVLGKYNIENNEITDFNVKRLELFIAYNHLKQSNLPHCESCSYNTICPGFCLGNSYENYKNPFIPTKEVCEMYKSKFNFLIQKYYNMGLFEYLDEIKSQLPLAGYNYLTKLIKSIVENKE